MMCVSADLGWEPGQSPICLRVLRVSAQGAVPYSDTARVAGQDGALIRFLQEPVPRTGWRWWCAAWVSINLLSCYCFLHSAVTLKVATIIPRFA